MSFIHYLINYISGGKHYVFRETSNKEIKEVKANEKFAPEVDTEISVATREPHISLEKADAIFERLCANIESGNI